MLLAKSETTVSTIKSTTCKHDSGHEVENEHNTKIIIIQKGWNRYFYDYRSLGVLLQEYKGQIPDYLQQSETIGTELA